MRPSDRSMRARMQRRESRQDGVERSHAGSAMRPTVRPPPARSATWSAAGRAAPASRAFRGAARPCRPCRARCRYSARWKPSGRRSRIVCSITRAPAKPITRARLGDMDVAEHGVGGGDAAGGRIGQHDDIGQLGRAQPLHGDRGARHLHQREHALLHARAARGGEDHERRAPLDRCRSCRRRSPRPPPCRACRPERRNPAPRRHRHALERAGARAMTASCSAGLGAMLLEPVGVALDVAEFQRIGRHLRRSAARHSAPSSNKAASRALAPIAMW